MDTLSRVRNMLLETRFTGREKEQAPGEAGPGTAVGLPAAFAGAIGKHVRDTASLAGVEFLEFIETEKVIVVGESYPFEGIGSCAPALEAGGFPPDGCRHVHRG